MKTPDELNALKEEVETLNKKLAELNEDELTQVTGGLVPIPYWRSEIMPGSGGFDRFSKPVEVLTKG